MSVVGRVLAALAGAACLGATLVVATAPTVAAAPTRLKVSPSVAPTGTPVTISGASCAGPVDLQLVSLVGSGLTTVDTVEATPAADGRWSTTVPMPAQAAHVTATCDGTSAVPVVLGPDPGWRHGAWATMLGTDRVVFTGTGLVDGSLYRVVSPTGVELGFDVVDHGVGQVVLPWTPQLTVAMTLELHPWPTGMLPVVQAVDVPLNQRITMTPRAAHRGKPVTVTGNRCVRGQVTIGVSGESDGWDDPATRYAGTTLTVGASGTWSWTFPAPPGVAAVGVACTVPDGAYDGARFVLGALDGPFRRGTMTLTRTGAILQADASHDADPAGRLVAYRPDGSTVPLTRLDRSTVFVAGRPGPIILLEFWVFGENANALADDSPRQVLFNLPGPVTPPAGATATPRPATPRPATPRAVTARPAGSTSDLAASPAELPATGPAPTGQVVLGLGLLLLGLALQVTARVVPRPVRARTQAVVHTPSSLPAGSWNMNLRPPGNS